jgi:DNA-binding transcriptional regulator LsrR (DeoR family)
MEFTPASSKLGMMKSPKPKAAKAKIQAANSTIQGTLVQVAHLYFDDNLSQQEIATRLGVSRSLIAQYLQHAREAGIVRIQIVDPTDACSELEAWLRKATGVSRITVIPNPRGSELLMVRAVAMAAAEFISSSLKDGCTLGLAWGRTTSEVVDHIGLPQAQQLNVLPLMGETSHSGLHSQMSRMIMQAAQRLRAKAHFLSLPMVVSSAGLRNALFKEDGCRYVIEAWDNVTVACFGIGTVPPVPGMVAYIGEKYLPRLLEEGAVGDICGIYFNREDRARGPDDRDQPVPTQSGRSCGGSGLRRGKGCGCSGGIADGFDLRDLHGPGDGRADPRHHPGGIARPAKSL